MVRSKLDRYRYLSLFKGFLRIFLQILVGMVFGSK